MKSLKSRIPQPMSKLEELRWKTKLNIPLAKTLDGTPRKIYIAEKSNHVFFHDESKGNDVSTDITGKIWGYGFDPNDVSSPGPTLEAIEKKTVNIEWVNSLSQAHHPFVEPPRELRSPGMMSRYDVGHTVVHLHGAHVPWISDGYPMRVSKGMGKNPLNKKTVLRPGQSEIFEYPNTQPGGATLWYHDHTMDMTAMNVYAGLAGAYLLRHENEHTLASLPKEEYEIPLIIQDRSFTDDNELLYGDADFLNKYRGNDLPDGQSKGDFRAGFFDGTGVQPSPEFKGQIICVNGKIWPFLEVEPRPYRFRIVNGSNSRIYVLRVSQATPSQDPDVNSLKTTIPIYQIGSDGGLFATVVTLSGAKIDPPPADGSSIVSPKQFLVLSPGERADVIIDFSGKLGESFYLTNHAEDKSPLGNGGDAVVDRAKLPILTNGILKFIVKTAVTQNSTSPLTFNETKLNLDLASIASLPDLATNLPIPRKPTRQFVIKEFGPVPLTLEEAIKPAPRGWKAITFQPNIQQPLKRGFLWAGLPPSAYDYGALPNGGAFPDPVLPAHHLGSKIELWEFYNISPDVHPIHLHHSSVQLHSRVTLSNPISQTIQGEFGNNDNIDANEKGWKDTVRVNPGELTTILVRFDDRGDKCHDYTGHYVWHCHILEHEDMGMMRPLEIKK
jgi:spore coat protein A, manganese oxidase